MVLGKKRKNNDAIDEVRALTEKNRGARDPVIAARIVDLRRDAAKGGAHSSRGTWPPKVQDRLRDDDGIPEISRDQLTAELLRTAVFRHGALLVRNLINDQHVERLIADIDRAFEAFDHAREPGAEARVSDWYRTFEPNATVSIPRDWSRAGGGVLAVDAPMALFDIIEAFESAGVGEVVEGFLGETPVILAKKWTLRRARESEAYPVWHQDGAFMGRDIRSLDVWVALSPCGLDAPGLEVVARRLDDIVDHGTEGARFDWCVADAVAERVGGPDLVSPVFNAGDALLFDHMLLHRTALLPTMTRERYAIEAWFAAPSSYPEDDVGLAY